MIMHLNGINAFLAQATATQPAATPAGTAGPTDTQLTPMQQLFQSPIILIVLMVVMMYFLMIRPQSQQRKRQAKLLESLKPGDKVVTTSGIVGVVVSVKDRMVSIRSADAKMEMTKSAVVEILERGGDEKSAS
jgi:preprotein translocase subunit YajC